MKQRSRNKSNPEAGFSLASVLVAVGIMGIAVYAGNKLMNNMKKKEQRDARRAEATKSTESVRKEVYNAVRYLKKGAWDDFEPGTALTFRLVSPRDFDDEYSVTVETRCVRNDKINRHLGYLNFNRHRPQNRGPAGACLRRARCPRNRKPAVRVFYSGNHPFRGVKLQSPRRGAHPMKDPFATAVCFDMQEDLLQVTIESAWVSHKNHRNNQFVYYADSTRLEFYERTGQNFQLVK